MNLQQFKGVVVACPTPFTKHGTVDIDTTKKLAQYYFSNGVNALFALSSTGEYFTMAQKERLRFVNACIESAEKKGPVLAMVSDACLENVKENIKTMCSLGIDAVVLTAPYYYKYSQSELETFFLSAADSSAVPLILYNQPTRLPSILSENLVLNLSKHENIIGLKDTTAEVSRLESMATNFKQRDDFVYYSGSESLAGYAALHGVNFVYALASVEPKLFADMKESAKQGDTHAVLSAQKKVAKLFGLFSALQGGSGESFNNFIIAIKAALELKGYGKAYSSQMGSLPTAEEYEKIRKIIEV